MSKVSLHDLHQGILLLQRRMRLLRNSTPFHVDAEASKILPVIATRQSLHAKDLAKYLVTSQTQVSRWLKRMVSEGYLEIRAANFDARFKIISFTKLGRKLLADIVALDNYFAAIGLLPLTAEERQSLTVYFDNFASALGADPEPALDGEDPWVTHQKRMARVMGMLGDNYMETGFSILEYQVLFEVSRVGGARFRDLRESLPLEPTFLSRLTDRYVKEGLFSKEEVPGDRRGVKIIISSEGSRLFDHLEEKVAVRLNEGLRTFSDQRIREFSQLLLRPALSALPPAMPNLPISSR